MTTPNGVQDDELSEITAPYLRAFRQDVVPAHAKRNAMLAMGLGVATATSSTALAAAALGGVGRATALAVAKSIAGGALAGAVVLGASAYVQERSAPRPAPATSAAEVSARATVGPRAVTGRNATPSTLELLPVDSESAGVETDEPSLGAARPLPEPPSREQPALSASPSREPRAPAEARVVAPSGSATPAGAIALDAPASALGREVRMLDEARAALASGDSAKALLILDQYASEFRAGSLGPESVVLRIEALLRAGEPGRAQALAQQFEGAHPHDSHIGRIRSLLSRAHATP